MLHSADKTNSCDILEFFVFLPGKVFRLARYLNQAENCISLLAYWKAF